MNTSKTENALQNMLSSDDGVINRHLFFKDEISEIEVCDDHDEISINLWSEQKFSEGIEINDGLIWKAVQTVSKHQKKSYVSKHEWEHEWEWNDSVENLKHEKIHATNLQLQEQYNAMVTKIQYLQEQMLDFEVSDDDGLLAQISDDTPMVVNKPNQTTVQQKVSELKHHDEIVNKRLQQDIYLSRLKLQDEQNKAQSKARRLDLQLKQMESKHAQKPTASTNSVEFSERTNLISSRKKLLDGQKMNIEKLEKEYDKNRANNLVSRLRNNVDYQAKGTKQNNGIIKLDLTKPKTKNTGVNIVWQKAKNFERRIELVEKLLHKLDKGVNAARGRKRF